MILGSVEDEWVSNELAYIKSKVWNKMNKNLEICLIIYTSKYALKFFPYDRVVSTWDSIANRRGASKTQCAKDAKNREVEIILKYEFY